METVRTQIENSINNGDLQNAIYLLIENTTSNEHRNYLCTLLGELTRTGYDRHLIAYDDYNRTINRITNSLLDFLAHLELKGTPKSIKKGYAVHNIPSNMTLGKKTLCEIKISDEQIETIKTKFKKIFEDIYLRDEMEINVSSSDNAFTIEPLNKDTKQSFLSGESNSWKFWITGNKEGKHELILTITGFLNNFLHKTQKREDITVVKIAVTMSKGQNLDPECALPIYSPTNIYYGKSTVAQRALLYAVKGGVPQIAVILGIVFLLFNIHAPIVNGAESNEFRIVMPNTFPFHSKETTVALIDAYNAHFERNSKRQDVLVINSKEKTFESKALAYNTTNGKTKVFKMTVSDIGSNLPIVKLRLIDSITTPIDSLLILTLPKDCAFHKPNVIIGDIKYQNWKLIDAQTILLKDAFTNLRDKIHVIDTIINNSNHKIEKITISSINLAIQKSTKNVLYLECPIEKYDFTKAQIILKDFTTLGGKVIINDTNQFKFFVNNKVYKLPQMAFSNDTLMPILNVDRRYIFNVVYKSPKGLIIKSKAPLDTFLLDYTKKVVLNLSSEGGKRYKDSNATVTLNFPNKFFTKPEITINKGIKKEIASINNNSLKLILPLNKTFTIKAKEDNHLGQVTIKTNNDMIVKDFNYQSIPYKIRFKLSDKLRHLQKDILVKRKNGEVKVKFDKDYCIVQFYNANKVDGSEQIDLTLPHDNLLICCYKGKLKAGEIKEWNCGEFCRACEEQTKMQAVVKQK